ncbi:hypothetical protein GCM10023094_35010 [Rhodococcus olei]|uniref:Uncharacterized protein n=1 Tax=Rhodococcus olei TaxID=2161675 RepID=A0ABP8P856_9NOCA
MKLRKRYRRKAQELRAALSSTLPDAHAVFPSSGFHALLELTDTTEAAVAEHAARRGVRVRGLGEHVLQGAPMPPALVLGYGSVGRTALPSVVADLRDSIEAARSTSPTPNRTPRGRSQGFRRQPPHRVRVVGVVTRIGARSRCNQ